MSDSRSIDTRSGGTLSNLRFPSVVAITSPGCAHCRAIRPRLEQAAVVHRTVDYREVSAEDARELVAAHRVRSVPTVLAFRGVEMVARHVGAGSQRDVERLFLAAEGSVDKKGSLGRTDRILRTLGGLALAFVGALASAVWLVPIGAALILAGWFDLIGVAPGDGLT